MDTSERYVGMCDCPEIQDCRPDIQGLVWCTGICHEKLDTYWQKPGPLVFPGPNSRKVVWLPRQDQLQDMVPNKGWEDDWNPSQWPLHLAHVLEEYSSAMYDYWQSVPGQPESMEQLWLMFVMQEKHHKTWHDGWTWYNKE